MPRTTSPTPTKSKEHAAEMFRKYTPFLRRLSQARKFLHDGDAEEAFSFYCEKFVTAYKDWRPERGKFITFLYLRATTSSKNTSNDNTEPQDPDTLTAPCLNPEDQSSLNEQLRRMSLDARVLSSIVLCPREPLPHKLNSARRAVKDTALRMGMNDWSVLSSWEEVRTTIMEARSA